ncbi:hypothetical protein BVL41_04025 [Corynebacterium diphtheriae]|nr:hypothetical protein BHU48_03635 [Corynebacterium diphtheriae]OMO44639.1 hypothetical protein BVL41_04025 [Corynebacterium diphtheriae]
MPKLTGKLKTITEYPSAVREVLLRAPRTRTAGKAVIVDEPVRVIVDEAGEFTATIAPGAAVLVLIGTDFMARESIPLLVAEGMTTIAEAMEAARDFTPDVHDRLAELADEVARGIKATGEAVKATAADREKVEAAAKSVEASSSAAKAAEVSVSSAWQQVKDRLTQWEERAQQLDKWQPQYEWLKENTEKSFAVVQEKITQATDALIAQVRGDAESAKRDAATAGQHSLKAQASAKSAESSVQRVVNEAIAKLKGNAPEMLDTLEELAERVKAGGTLEAEILQKLSKMADSDTVKQLKSRLDSLDIASVKGLSGALAGKANSTHTHNMSDVIGLENLANSHARMETRVSSIHREVSQKADKNGIADIITEVIGINKIEVVDRKPYQPQQGTLYLIRE